MIRDTYNIVLRLKTPSEKGKALDFREETASVLDAAAAFNDKFRSWSKRLVAVDIDKHYLSLLLFVEKDKEHVTVREIRSFTAYLYHEGGWEQYSRETSKLFEGTLLNRLACDEAIRMLDGMDNPALMQAQGQEIAEVRDLLERQAKQVGIQLDEARLGGYDSLEISDEQALAVLDCLMKTQHLGKKQKKKREDIAGIKKILEEWIQ